ICVGKVQGAEVKGVESPSSNASSARRVSSRLAGKDAFRQGHRLRVPERQAQGQEATVSVHHGAEIPQARGSEGRSDQGTGEGAFRLSQLPPCAGDGARQTESGCEDGAGDAAS